MQKRAKIIARLEEQKLLLSNPSHIRTFQKVVRKDGERSIVEKQQRVQPWWQMDQSGAYVMSVRVGSKPIEFEKGKAGAPSQP
jgi:hypothetical protein